MINKGRIKSIGTFLKAGGYFPTNLLVNFTETCRFDLLSNKENSDPNIKFGWLYLPKKYKAAWIIDGQHRLYGFSHLDKEQTEASIFVIAFEKMDTKTEADLFITINHKQKTVPKSVLIALQSDLKWGSEDAKERVVALASALVKSLNSDPTSPLFQRFSIQGVPSRENQSLTLPEVVNGLVRSNLLGRAGRLYSPGALCGLTDEETITRARKVLNGYFSCLAKTNPGRWESGKPGYVAVNVGIRSHLLLIGEIIRYAQRQDTSLDPLTVAVEQIAKITEDIASPIFEYFAKADDSTIADRFSRKFGEGGVKEYFFDLCEILHSARSDFGSPEFQNHLAKKADQRVSETDQAIRDLDKTIRDYVIFDLKKRYGTKEMKSGEKAYWDVGIRNSTIKEDAYKKQQQTPADKRLPKETYLDLLDAMKIVRQKEEWPSFEPIFSIPMDGEKGKTYYLSWLERLNELRKIVAHPSPLRTYEEDDYKFVAWLKRELYGRIEKTDYSWNSYPDKASIRPVMS